MPFTDYTHHYEQFSANCMDLAGSPKRAVLPELVDRDNQTGSIIWLDGAGAGNDLTIQDLKTDKKNRATYEKEVTKTLEKWNAIHTPHNEIALQRTQAEPKIIEWGYTFDEDEDILEIVSPENKKMRNGMRSIFKAQDQQVLNGIKEASVVRQDENRENQTITFPASQEFTTAQANYIGRKDMTTMVKMMEDQYLDEPLLCLISPTDKKNIIDNDDKITDADFIPRSSGFGDDGKFSVGKFPEIFGIRFIVHPLVPAGSFYGFTKESIVRNVFKPLKSTMSRVPEQREGHQAYVREKADVKRVDDLQVIHGTVQ